MAARLHQIPHSSYATYFGWDGLLNLSSDEVESSLQIVATLGRGSLGIVDEVKAPSKNGVSFVRKRVLLPHIRRKQLLDIVKSEAEVVMALSHTHIVNVFGTYEHAPSSGLPSFSLLMAPVGDSDLARFLHEAGDDSWGLRPNNQENFWLRQWFSCLASALVYMHAQGVRHQDIKPSNIIHRGGHIFFTDFSSSTRFEPGCTTSTENPTRSSAMYSAPEILDRALDDSYSRHGLGSDIFSLGCVFVEMLLVLNGQSVTKFREQTLRKRNGLVCYSRNQTEIGSAISTYSKNTSVYYSIVVYPMLHPDRKERPSAEQVLNKIGVLGDHFIACRCGTPYPTGVNDLYENPTSSAPPLPPTSGISSVPPSAPSNPQSAPPPPPSHSRQQPLSLEPLPSPRLVSSKSRPKQLVDHFSFEVPLSPDHPSRSLNRKSMFDPPPSPPGLAGLLNRPLHSADKRATRSPPPRAQYSRRESPTLLTRRSATQPVPSHRPEKEVSGNTNKTRRKKKKNEPQAGNWFLRWTAGKAPPLA
ncbi:kinase-like protein [Zopfia rhizophila CBS 207.26]|uniref:non-specific serine/threonine protein kinase n=1 Tax=Zopfia rhizophila CBS 207.26 TaxID=1314779 RepID=A0A6A6DUZ1_9PEZI|nr:kinase-like protein [Zopfia rhizophila CBS 207.26]